ncbi:hypothetical protein ACWCPS_39770 [Streptomyces mauvecolor]
MQQTNNPRTNKPLAVTDAMDSNPKRDLPPRLTFAQVTPVIAFPAMGSSLALCGIPAPEIYQLLTYCGGIGVAVLAAACGGRRLATGLAQLFLYLGK